MAKRHAAHYPINSFVLFIERKLYKHLKPYGIKSPNPYTRTGIIAYSVVGAGLFGIIFFSNYVFNIGPRTRMKISQDRRSYYRFLKENDLPKNFDPLKNEDHIDSFSKAQKDILKKRLGIENRKEYNPFQPEYYLHVLPPKDRKENLLWMQKARNWGDYQKWIEKEHPKEFEELKNRKYFK